jgi:flagellar hook-associated protein 3 FlgL
MIRSIDAVNDHFLNALSQLQSRLQTAQRQLASGVRIERASDAPDRVADLIRRQSDVSYSEQVRKNLARIQAEVDTAEASLQRAVDLVDLVIGVGVQATNINVDQGQRDVFAQRVRQFHEELVRLSLASAEGRFVFGGDNDQQAPYQLNAANPNGVDRLTNGSATRLVLDFDGSRFLAGKTAQEIFDHRNTDDSLAEDNAFAAVHSLAEALEGGDQAGIEAALGQLRLAHAYLNRQFGFYGSTQNRIENSLNQGHQAELRYRAELSAIRDTDVAAAALEIEQIQTSIEAALRSRAVTSSIPNLFSFLR